MKEEVGSVGLIGFSKQGNGPASSQGFKAGSEQHTQRYKQITSIIPGLRMMKKVAAGAGEWPQDCGLKGSLTGRPLPSLRNDHTHRGPIISLDPVSVDKTWVWQRAPSSCRFPPFAPGCVLKFVKRPAGSWERSEVGLQIGWSPHDGKSALREKERKELSLCFCLSISLCLCLSWRDITKASYQQARKWALTWHWIR